MRKPGLFLRSQPAAPAARPAGAPSDSGGWRLLALLLVSGLLAACLLTVAPAFAAPADEGETLATEKCSDCHAVTSESYAGPLPTLYEIAAESRYWTPTRFEAWLSSSHGPMPEFRLTSQDIYNLMQYLERLRSEANLEPGF